MATGRIQYAVLCVVTDNSRPTVSTQGEGHCAPRPDSEQHHAWGPGQSHHQ